MVARPLILAALVAVTVAAAPASAEAREARVSLAGLDLADPTHVDTLRHKLRRAAAQVCGRLDSRPLSAKMAIARCRADALEGAMPAMYLAIAVAEAGRELAASNGAITMATR